MAQGLKALTVLLTASVKSTSCSIPSTDVAAYNCVVSSVPGILGLFLLYRALPHVRPYAYISAHAHKNKTKIKRIFNPREPELVT